MASLPLASGGVAEMLARQHNDREQALDLRSRQTEPRAATRACGGNNTRRYVFKLYPNADQAAVLHEQREMMADLWNALKQRIEDTYRRERRMLSFFDLTNEITTLRHECPEWEVVPAITSHRVAKVLTEAYAAFFRRVKSGEAPGYPRWRAKKNAAGIPLGTMAKTGWRLVQREDNPRSWRLHYGSVTDIRQPATWIHARGALPAPPDKWRNGDILWRDRRWWLSLCVDLPGSAGTESEPRNPSIIGSAGTESHVPPATGSSENERRTGRGTACWPADKAGVGVSPIRIEFDLIDSFARLFAGSEEKPRAQWPFGNVYARYLDALQEDIDRLKSERDQRWPHGKRRNDDEQREFVAQSQEIAALFARATRIRTNALHVWTAGIVARASDLTIIAPDLRRDIKTPRGDKKQWGANVDAVSTLNRSILAQAPGLAIQMLEYKAAQKGIRCDVVKAPMLVVGSELVTAGKTVRQARRQLKRIAA